jgi:hypothetical protein
MYSARFAATPQLTGAVEDGCDEALVAALRVDATVCETLKLPRPQVGELLRCQPALTWSVPATE